MNSSGQLEEIELFRMDGSIIPKWKDKLLIPQEINIKKTCHEPEKLNILIQEDLVPILPKGFIPPESDEYQKTWVWRYNDPTKRTSDSYIGPIITVPRNQKLDIRWINTLTDTGQTNVKFWPKTVDQTVHWANVGQLPHMNMCTVGSLPPPAPLIFFEKYQGPIPIVTHLHGAEVQSNSDGHPDNWYTKNFTRVGPAFDKDLKDLSKYINTQESCPLWFHDHTMGVTRLSVYAGLAGLYSILPENPKMLPKGLTPTGLDRCGGRNTNVPIIPLVVQDRNFDKTGQLFYPSIGTYPIYHPRWRVELAGNTIVTNGKTWPRIGCKHKPLNPMRYRFLMLNGSNARTFRVWLTDSEIKDEFGNFVEGPPIWVIASDGGYLDLPAKVETNKLQSPITKNGKLLVQPAERYDFIVDFNDKCWKKRIKKYGYSGSLILRNNAGTVFPSNPNTDPSSDTGQIIKIYVHNPITFKKCFKDKSYNPASGIPLRKTSINRLAIGTNPNVKVNKIRQLTISANLLPLAGQIQPFKLLLNNTNWLDPNDQASSQFTENPYEGDVEIWEYINLDIVTHPMHIHLIEFQILSRQKFDTDAYQETYNKLFPENDPNFAVGCGPPGKPDLEGKGDFKTSISHRYNNYPNENDELTGAPIVGGNPNVEPFLIGPNLPPSPEESGWKDVAPAWSGYVTRVIVKFSPTDKDKFPFKADTGPGYVWHCHMLGHEDNELMRRYLVQSK